MGYLRNQKRYMNYFAMREQHFPIGSGVVESACKQIFSERMKLSAMRWKSEGAQAVMTLRSIKLSSIWDNVFGRMLNDVQPVSDATTIKKWILPIQPAHKADRTLHHKQYDQKFITVPLSMYFGKIIKVGSGSWHR